MEEVKKNIKMFMEILEIGKTESVVHWDESNFKRAERWAQYAEEVYKKLKNKPSLVQVLSNYMNIMQKSKEGYVTQSMTFNNLQNATETLRKVLLNNPHLSSTQFSHVLDMYKVDFTVLSNKNLEKLIMDTYSLSCNKGIFLTLTSIRDQFSSEHLTERLELKTSEEICLDTCAKLLLGKLNLKQRGDGLTEDNSFINKIESLVSNNDKGMEIVLRMLLNIIKGKIAVNKSSSEMRDLDEIKCTIHGWIIECSKKEGTDYYKKLWSCPSSLLYEISTMDVTICENFLSFIHLCGDNLLGIAGSDIFDNYETNYGSRYQNIVKQIQLLLQGPEHVIELCKQRLKLWSVKSTGELSTSLDAPRNDEILRVNLWKKIYRDVKV